MNRKYTTLEWFLYLCVSVLAVLLVVLLYNVFYSSTHTESTSNSVPRVIVYDRTVSNS